MAGPGGPAAGEGEAAPQVSPAALALLPRGSRGSPSLSSGVTGPNTSLGHVSAGWCSQPGPGVWSSTVPAPPPCPPPLLPMEANFVKFHCIFLETLTSEEPNGSSYRWASKQPPHYHLGTRNPPPAGQTALLGAAFSLCPCSSSAEVLPTCS